MAPLPDYQQRVELGAGPRPSVGPIPLPGIPNAPNTAVIGEAMSGLGKELSAVEEKLRQGEQHTATSQAMEGYLTGLASLQQKYTDDQDYSTAEGRFKDELATLQREQLSGIADPGLRARASLEMTRSAIAAGSKVHGAQVARQADINLSADDTLSAASLTEATTAATPVERQAAIDRRLANLERLHAAGWIDAQTAVKRTTAFRGQLDQADAMALVQNNPAAAKAALANPQMFASLDPVRRTSLTIAAEGRMDANTQATITNAAAFHPEAATLSVGRVIAPDHASRIFDNGIVPIESAGDAKAVSGKGALGLAQIMPATAREVAKGLGLNDVAALPDAELKDRLLTDQSLNLRLGRTYWQQMVTRYDGNVALAAVAYNAGPGRADAWKAKAEAQFGAGFSPAQLASVVDIKESRDYLGKLYGKFGAPMDTAFSSPAAAQHAASAVGAVLQQQQAREAHLLKTQASAVATSDPIVDIVRQGFDVDPMRVATFRSAQSAAAASGDAAAAARLRDLDFAEKMQPIIRDAWQKPPAQLDAAITTLEAQMAAPGGNPTQQGLDALGALKSVRDEQIKRRDSEPVVLGGEGGGRYYALRPILPDRAIDDQMIADLRARDAQAQTAHRIYGGTGSPFTAQEAESWHQKYLEATPADRAAILGGFAKGLAPQTFAAALPQIVAGTNAKDERPALTIAAGLFSAAPGVAPSILQGIEAQRADARYLPSAGATKVAYQTSKDSYLPPGIFSVAGRADPKGPYAALSDAIDARYAFLSAQAKDVSGAPDTSRLKQAVEDVTGGVLRHNGAPLIAPSRGMTQAQFDAVLWGVSNDDLKDARTTSGKPIDADFLRGQAKLSARADGQYYLQLNRDDERPQYAVTASGAPFVLDLRGRKPAVEPTTSAQRWSDAFSSSWPRVTP